MKTNMWKRNLAAVMTATVVLAGAGTSVPVFAKEAQEENKTKTMNGFEYQINEDKKTQKTYVVICKYTGNEKNITIPKSIEGIPVTAIGMSAFSGSKTLESLVIPNNIKTLGWWAFSNCTKLKNLKLSGSVSEIGMDCFSGCTSLTSVTIPNGVKSLAPGAFMHCTKLNTVKLPKTLTSIYMPAFAGCTSLKSITIPSKVSMIDYGAFMKCKNLKNIKIKTSLLKSKSVREKAFEGIHRKAVIKVPAKKLSSYKRILRRGQAKSVKIKK